MRGIRRTAADRIAEEVIISWIVVVEDEIYEDSILDK